MTINTNALDAMLNYVASSANLKLCLCQTEPLTLADCTNLSGSGGKRITTETTITGEVSITDGINAQSRKFTIPSKVKTNGALVAVSDVSADLWLTVYNDTELLFSSGTAITDEEVVLNATVTTPPFEWGVNQ